MQTCALCNAQSPDTATHCVHCGADLSEHATTVVALRRLQANPRVRAIRIAVAHDACPACYALHGTYPKDAVPRLPVEGCSHEHGCRCYYEPLLDDIVP